MFRSVFIALSLFLILTLLGGLDSPKTGVSHDSNPVITSRLSDVSRSRSQETGSKRFGTATAETQRAVPGAYPFEDFTSDIAYKVVRVIDGDTVKIDYKGRVTSVRLIGVDAPETVHPGKPVEAYGPEASDFVENLLLGESVYLRFDAERVDMYGRLLAYLYRAPDGLFVNLELVRQGYGSLYAQFPFKFMTLFRYYEDRARAARKGLYQQSKAGNQYATARRDTAPLQSAAIESESAGEVYVTRTGKKYHSDGCKSLRRSKIPISLSEAKARYGPCRLCNPPR